MRIMSIDASINEVGVAIIERGEYRESYTFKTTKEKDVIGKLKELYEHFNKIKKEHDYVLIERPDNFMRLGKYGIKNVESIQILNMAIGCIVGSLIDRYKVVFVKVSEWKGMTKKKTTQYIARMHTDKKLNTHEADAFVMAKHWLQIDRFKQAIRRTRT